MICIISTNTPEQATDEVIDWLSVFGVPWVRFNGQALSGDGVVTIKLGNGSADTECYVASGQSEVDLSKITVVWYRRWRHDRVYRDEILLERSDEIGNATTLARHLDAEFATVAQFLSTSLSHAEWLSDPASSKVNKLLALAVASGIGLDIPSTIVSTDRRELIAFAEQHEEVVCKALSNAMRYTLGGKTYATYTEPVDAEDLQLRGLTSSTFPTLLQERLKKAYEIRTFYLDEFFYSMAIFSQNSSATSIDFRHYNYECPSRTVPYKLPHGCEVKLKLLMDKLGLNTGSIDLVKTTDGRVVFLEVNPRGQFGMISHPCNYHLEHAVATALVKRLRIS